MPATTQPTAYSYVRFSDPSQLKGDSLRRQTEAAADWCLRHKAALDASLTLRDLGKSAFRGKHRENPDRHALAAFLRQVEQGRVPRGSYLVIENLDRLSREHIRPALGLLLDLIEAGVRVVQLRPVEQVFGEDVEPMQLMMAIMELTRGHNESAIKSERVGAAWSQRRKAVRGGEGILTRRLPAWVEERGGRLVAVPQRAAVVRRIFDLAGSGHGLYAIMRRLTDEGVPAFGPSGRWSVSYLDLILKDRRAVGELQPRGQGGKPDGEPIPGYFPRVVSDEAWALARLGASERHRRPGRRSAEVNVFQGLLRDARTGASYTAGAESGKRAYRVLMSAAPRLGEGRAFTFPLAVFEEALLKLLREIDPHEILNGDGGPDETLALAGELAAVEGSIAAVVADLEAHGDSPALFARLRAKEARAAALKQQLAEARQKAAHPLSETWGELESLLDALAAAPDPAEARLRLRSALRRAVDSIWLLVVPRGRDRLCAAQVWFSGGEKCRDYIIMNRPTKANASARVEGGCRAKALAFAGERDLRKREDAARAATALAGADVEALWQLLAVDVDARGGAR
jgi:DNA invertase Pin-like site-specific DNA recombinase